MIGDVLSDALASIEEYQGKYPGYYDRTRDEIERVKLAMTRLMINLDAPPGTTPEMWAEGMIRLGESDPMSLKRLMSNRVYHVRREQVAESLGGAHPLLEMLSEAEAAGADREAELGGALDAYSDPTNPEYDPDFDRQIRSLRPDWFVDNEQG